MVNAAGPVGRDSRLRRGDRRAALAWTSISPRSRSCRRTESLLVGTPNMWTTAVGDEKLGLVYLPMGNSAGDYHTALRSEEEKKYSSALVALDVSTGKPRWSSRPCITTCGLRPRLATDADRVPRHRWQAAGDFAADQGRRHLRARPRHRKAAAPGRRSCRPARRSGARPALPDATFSVTTRCANPIWSSATCGITPVDQ